jgi:hypothetical protein
MRCDKVLALANAGKVTGIILLLQVILNHFSTRAQFDSSGSSVTDQRYCQVKEFSENDSMKELLNSQEQRRIKIQRQILRGALSIAQAASLLKCPERHFYWLKVNYRKKGAGTIMHGNRGRVSRRRLSNEV